MSFKSIWWTMFIGAVFGILVMGVLTFMAMDRGFWWVPCLLVACGWGWFLGRLIGIKDDLDEMIKKEEKPDGYR